MSQAESEKAENANYSEVAKINVHALKGEVKRVRERWWREGGDKK